MIPDMRRLLEETRATRPDITTDERVVQFKDCRKALAHACERVGIPRLTHHDLRHHSECRIIPSAA